VAKDFTTLKVILHKRTDKAVRVSMDGSEDSAVWVPLSEVEIEEGPTVNGTTYHDLILPRWLADKKGLA
jgi:hypothetical protein